jgi:hypothetical protein
MDYLQQRLAMKNGTMVKPEKKAYVIPKVSAKKKQADKEAKPDKEEQLQWFKDRVEESTGCCLECGEPINKSNFTFAIMTVAHVLAKRNNQFPSVKTNIHNSLELCVTNGCHYKYDRSWEDAATMKVWPLAVEKFKLIYPSIAPNERKHLPDILLQEIEPK